MTAALLRSRSSLLMPAVRAMPAVMTTMSALPASASVLHPTTRESLLLEGSEWLMSMALPRARSSTTSWRYTVPRRLDAMEAALVEPTMPAPMTRMRGLIMAPVFSGYLGPGDDAVEEARHESVQVHPDDLLAAYEDLVLALSHGLDDPFGATGGRHAGGLGFIHDPVA